MKSRKIIRAALLQDYTGHPENLLGLFEEVVSKGYQSVCFEARQEEFDLFRMLADKAHSLGLDICAFTGFMKYAESYLADHPDQVMVGVDENAWSSLWGCPFNPDFKARYLDFLRRLAACDGVGRIWLNDEAFLPTSGCHCDTCRKSYQDKFGHPMPRVANPSEKDWDDPVWRSYLNWNIVRWADVHGEMARVIHEVNPSVNAIFQASPACDLYLNPWTHSVDMSLMAEQLDGLCSDPYYTFHDVPSFTPKETYLSQWCKFLRGIMPTGGIVEIVPQAFSHPSFTRPLTSEDGYISAIVPSACGVDIITPYTYTLQRCSPVQETYESAMKLDPHYEQVEPLKYAALVHGGQSEIYTHPLPAVGPEAYDGTRLLPVAHALRETGTPYNYLSDTNLGLPGALADYKALVLPEVNCLSDDQQQGIRDFAASGGSLIILGNLGNADQNGQSRQVSLLEELTGIKISDRKAAYRLLQFPVDHLSVKNVRFPDPEVAANYWGGSYQPIFAMKHSADATVPGSAEVIAEFVDGEGNKTGIPAVVSINRGKIIWLSGFPTLNVRNPKFSLNVRNLVHFILGSLVEFSVGQKPILRVEGWPPKVPMYDLRPVDPRFTTTYEFFASVGDTSCIATVASYFKEPAVFDIVLDLPVGKSVTNVTELITGKTLKWSQSGQSVRVGVSMGFDDAVLSCKFELAEG